MTDTTQPPAETLAEATVITISVRPDGSTSFHSKIPPGQNWLDTLAAMHHGFAEFQRQFEESHKCPVKPAALTRRAGGEVEGLPLAEVIADADRLADAIDHGQRTDASSIVDTLRRLAKVARRAGGDAIPAGMKPWSGGDAAPADWDGGPVLRRHGGLSMPDGDFAWVSNGGGLGNIIAYTPTDAADARSAFGAGFVAGVRIFNVHGDFSKEGEGAWSAYAPSTGHGARAVEESEAERIGLAVADLVERHLTNPAMIWGLPELPDGWMTELRSILVASLESELSTPKPPAGGDAIGQSDGDPDGWLAVKVNGEGGIVMPYGPLHAGPDRPADPRYRWAPFYLGEPQ